MILPALSKRVKILGKSWLLRFVKRPELGKICGDCAPPDSKRVIRVKCGMPGHLTLNTIIHEMLHASQWCLDEKHVNDLATDITRTILKPEIRLYWDR